ncbi:MAG: dTDP-4-dehydrorhamnose reductase [Alphaproteobacteria bacterium]|nr:dTDP-4-dehydrorhamnose reductase [Alphaproteobacteria bacterium]
MSILLIGASGQLGGALAPALAGLGTVFSPGRQELDLADPEGAARCVRALAPDLIVNAGAYTAVDQAESEPELAMTINGAAPGAIAAAARDLKAALVHYSTDYVFDGTKTEPYREDDATNPLNAYGRSKRAGELAIAAAGAAHLILRTSWLYGAKGRNFVHTMLRLGAERETLTVVQDQIGAPTSVGAVADATAQILAQSRGNPQGYLAATGGIVNLCCRGETSWHGFATAIFDEARKRGMPLRVSEVTPIATEDFPTAARRPLNSRLDLTRLKDRFGLETPDWRTALAAVMAEIAA